MNIKHFKPWMLLMLVLVLCACGPAPDNLLPGTASPQPSPMASPTPTGTPTPPMIWPVLVDTDMALDDWIAILYLLKQSHYEIVAITISGTGEAHCEEGVRNAAGLVALAGHPPIPIACGRQTPLQGAHTFPESWRTASDTLHGLHLPEGSNPADPGLDAVGLIRQSAQTHGLTVLTLGPLTNLADAVQTDPSILQHIYRLIIMGGAVDVAGNLNAGGESNENTFAEWNFYIDPQAASIVLGSDWPIVLVPLDATNLAPLTLDFYARLQDDRDTPSEEFVYQALSQIYDQVTAGTYYFWDPLAAAVLADLPRTTFETRRLCVEVTEGARSGSLYEDGACPEIRIVAYANAAELEGSILRALNRKEHVK